MTWPVYAEQDWIEMQRDNAVYAADMDDDLLRITYAEIREFEMWMSMPFEYTDSSVWWLEEPRYDEPSRARRIRDKQRMKAKARRIFKNIADHIPVGSRQAYMKANERLADNLAHCNRWCCNKRRKHEGPPMQEIREAMRAEYNDASAV